MSCLALLPSHPFISALSCPLRACVPTWAEQKHRLKAEASVIFTTEHLVNTSHTLQSMRQCQPDKTNLASLTTAWGASMQQQLRETEFLLVKLFCCRGAPSSFAHAALLWHSCPQGSSGGSCDETHERLPICKKMKETGMLHASMP